MAKELKDRKDVEEALTWDLSAIYSSEDEYNAAIKELEELAKEIEKEFKGKLNTAENINKCLDKLRKVTEIIDLTGNYTELSLSVDHTNSDNVDRYMRFSNTMAQISSSLSFIDSEIIQGDEGLIDEAIKESKENRIYLEEIKRAKPHALHPEAERVLAALSGTLEAPYSIYEQAKLADMNFKSFTVDGKEYPLSFVLFENEWEYENDSKLRRAPLKPFQRN